MTNTSTSIYAVSNPVWTQYYLAADEDAALVASFNAAGYKHATLDAIAADLDTTVERMISGTAVDNINPEALAKEMFKVVPDALAAYASSVSLDSYGSTAVADYEDFEANEEFLGDLATVREMLDGSELFDRYDVALRALVEPAINKAIYDRTVKLAYTLFEQADDRPDDDQLEAFSYRVMDRLSINPSDVDRAIAEVRAAYDA